MKRNITNNAKTVALIKRLTSCEYAKNYLDSASFFNAVIETEPKRGYFIESRQFEDTYGNTEPREYILKCCAKRNNNKVASNISKVIEFKSKYKADSFFSDMEFTDTSALILERSQVTRSIFDAMTKRYTRIYDNGLTALYVNENHNSIKSYCEGSFVDIHALNDDIFDAEIKRHNDFYLANEA